MEWQAIQTAPRDGTHVLLFYPDLMRSVQIGFYDVYETRRNGKIETKWEKWNFGGLLTLPGNDPPEPTHWMPLPCDPKA